MVAQLESSLGLEKNVTLVGAPYDFRYTPDSPQGLSSDELAALVERAVTAAGEPATLISHSMGGLQVLYFLSRQTDAWKAKFVKRWIPISVSTIMS
jgi:lysophospholipase-3